MKNTFTRRGLTRALALGIAAIAVTACHSLAQTMERMPERTLTVLSTGSANATADQVELDLSVSSQDQTASGLFVKQNDIVERLKKALIAAGIKSADISEQPFRLMPNYEYGQQGTRIIGYRIETPLKLTIDNVRDLPHYIDLATQAGASTVTVGQFTMSSGGSLHDAALHDALSGARKEAEMLAKEMGKSVGDIVSITEMEGENAAPARASGGESEEQREHEMAAAANKPSTLSEKAELRVVFELK